MKKILIFIIISALFMSTVALSVASLDMAPYTVNSYEDYQQLIEENDLPEDFVYYDSVSMFGEFIKLEFYAMFTSYFTGDTTYYRYVFETEGSAPTLGGCEFMYLSIKSEYSDFDKYWGYSEIEIDEEEIFCIQEGKKYCIFDEAVYVYGKEGYLIAINWENDGKLFSLDFNFQEILSYPPDSIVGKLLNKNTAPEVIEMLKTYNFTGKPSEPQPPETADISVIFPILGIISAGGFTLFAVKRKKNK